MKMDNCGKEADRVTSLKVITTETAKSKVKEKRKKIEVGKNKQKTWEHENRLEGRGDIMKDI